MIPPGLAFISVSERAWEAQKTATRPRFYFDLEEAKKTLERGQTPFTPNVAAMYGLSLGLDKILEEGLEGVFGRHADIGQFTRDSIRELGLELLVSDERYASDTVTAVKDAGGSRRPGAHGPDADREECSLGRGTGEAEQQHIPHRASWPRHQG